VVVRFADFAVDSGSRQLLRGSSEVPLGPKAFALLELLLRSRPRALSKGQLLNQLWPGTFVSDSSLTSLVTQLRSALGDDPHRPRFIRTVYSFGYAFCGEVAAAGPGSSSGGVRFRLYLEDGQVALREGENVIGRTDDVVVLLDSASVSRRHARIVVSSGSAPLKTWAARTARFCAGSASAPPPC
jgi:DNA-binding winged helix-turn-helix (wHTH) protein